MGDRKGPRAYCMGHLSLRPSSQRRYSKSASGLRSRIIESSSCCRTFCFVCASTGAGASPARSRSPSKLESGDELDEETMRGSIPGIGGRASETCCAIDMLRICECTTSLLHGQLLDNIGYREAGIPPDTAEHIHDELVSQVGVGDTQVCEAFADQIERFERLRIVVLTVGLEDQLVTKSR